MADRMRAVANAVLLMDSPRRRCVVHGNEPPGTRVEGQVVILYAVRYSGRRMIGPRAPSVLSSDRVGDDQHDWTLVAAVENSD
jgi:hypothetical protein